MNADFFLKNPIRVHPVNLWRKNLLLVRAFDHDYENENENEERG